MTVDRNALSDGRIYALAHSSLKPRFYLALIFSMILFPLIAVGLVAGTVVLVVPFLGLLSWISSRVLFAFFLGNAILVSRLNYPRIFDIAEQLKVGMGYDKSIYIFVYEHGSFNAYMRFLFFRRAIFLNSELLETGVSDAEIRWLIGRFIGYLRVRRQAGLLGHLIRSAKTLVVFNLFLLPYDRAMVYTGDRLAMAAVGGDVSSVIAAMQKLIVGRQLGYSINPEGVIDQQRQVKGSLFAFLSRLTSGFPHMNSRYVDLIAFAKIYFPSQFTSFEAANPGLPADLPRLASSRQPRAVPGIDAAGLVGQAPHGWVCAGAMVMLFLAVGFGVRSLVASSPSYALEPLAMAPRPVAAPAVPAHVHRTAEGRLTPDAGCRWLSDAPGDFRVSCN